MTGYAAQVVLLGSLQLFLVFLLLPGVFLWSKRIRLDPAFLLHGLLAEIATLPGFYQKTSLVLDFGLLGRLELLEHCLVFFLQVLVPLGHYLNLSFKLGYVLLLLLLLLLVGFTTARLASWLLKWMWFFLVNYLLHFLPYSNVLPRQGLELAFPLSV